MLAPQVSRCNDRTLNDRNLFPIRRNLFDTALLTEFWTDCAAPSQPPRVSCSCCTQNAQYETEATLDKYFYHDNLPPFLASRLIQSFVTSNPSPRYIQAVANSFKTGMYGSSFGTGNYGDMSATIAAILLDQEARNPILDADPSHGLLREPILKVIAIMRGMEYKTDKPLTRLLYMHSKIGQMAHEFPSVFSFFLSEFKPSGRVGDAGLVSPESQLLDIPKMVGLLNDIVSLVDFGFNSCSSGFGAYERVWFGEYERTCNPYLKTNNSLKYEMPSSEVDFNFESFEGPSLKDGFDNTWVGYNWISNDGESGVLTEPVNKQNYSGETKTQLFAHNAMKSEVKRPDPNEFTPGTGVSGRMAD